MSGNRPANDATAKLEQVGYHPGLWTRLEPLWRAALAATPTASAFHSPEWIGSWLATYGPRLKPAALIWRDLAGLPVGACLISITKERLGPFPVRRAWLNATGEHEVMSEHNILLGAPEVQARLARDVADHLTVRRVDQLMLSGFRAEAAHTLRATHPPGATDGFESEDRFVDLEALRISGTEYLASLSRNTREQIRRSQRLYSATFGTLSVEVANGNEIPKAWWVEFMALHLERWQQRGTAGSFAKPSTNTFHERLRSVSAPQPHPTNGLRVHLVRVSAGDETIAYLYNLVFRGVVCFYQSGFRYHADNKLKPGLLAHALVIQHYCDQGELEYDFLAGETTAAQYKRSLAKSSRALVWEEISASTRYMRAVHALRLLRRHWRPTPDV